MEEKMEEIILTNKYGLRSAKKAITKKRFIEAYSQIDEANIYKLSKTLMISRQTFFNYFKDTEDYLIYILEKTIVDIFFETGFYDDKFIPKLVAQMTPELIGTWVTLIKDPSKRHVLTACELECLFEIDSMDIVNNIFRRYLGKRFLMEVINSL